MLRIKINVMREIHFPKTIFIKSIFNPIHFHKTFYIIKMQKEIDFFFCGMDKLLIRKILLKNYRISI